MDLNTHIRKHLSMHLNVRSKEDVHRITVLPWHKLDVPTGADEEPVVRFRGLNSTKTRGNFSPLEDGPADLLCFAKQIKDAGAFFPI